VQIKELYQHSPTRGGIPVIKMHQRYVRVCATPPLPATPPSPFPPPPSAAPPGSAARCANCAAHVRPFRPRKIASRSGIERRAGGGGRGGRWKGKKRRREEGGGRGRTWAEEGGKGRGAEHLRRRFSAKAFSLEISLERLNIHAKRHRILEADTGRQECNYRCDPGLQRGVKQQSRDWKAVQMGTRE
jgi:hypothetical protein